MIPKLAKRGAGLPQHSKKRPESTENDSNKFHTVRRCSPDEPRTVYDSPREWNAIVAHLYSPAVAEDDHRTERITENDTLDRWGARQSDQTSSKTDARNSRRWRGYVQDAGRKPCSSEDGSRCCGASSLTLKWPRIPLLIVIRHAH